MDKSVNDSPEVQADMIIIIHPGSLNLRIGRASDINPITLLQAIARKRKSNGAFYRDEFLPRCVDKTKELVQELEDSRLQVSHVLQSCLQSDGRRRYATPPQQISAFNRRSAPELMDDQCKNWSMETQDYFVGDEVLNVNPNGNYNLHFPMRKGELNLHNNVGGSLTSCLDDLQTIWEYVLAQKLAISLKDLENYKAVLVIPDIYNRVHLKELTHLLLNRMGFESCFLVQDHVAATFGAGLGYACVVDVGDQKTSVSCVEDGISHPNTRVRLEYGGADLVHTFYWLLQKCAFPYKDCDYRDPQDATLLRQLKEEFCHVNLDICGSQERIFEVHHPNKQYQRITMQVGDEAIVAPLGLFHTELMNLSGTVKRAKTQSPSNKLSDPEDCFDAEYLRETTGVTRRGTKEQIEQTISDGNMIGVATENGDEDIVVDNMETERESNNKDKDFVIPGTQIIGIDSAILQSIERCSSDEVKKKMYGSILIVGGGMKFVGIEKWLQNRLALQIPYMYRVNTYNIVTCPKEMNATITTWKGGAIMSCLESANELWIGRTEWQKHGLRILRERAPFLW